MIDAIRSRIRWRALSATGTCYAITLPSLVLLFTFIYLPVIWAFSKSLYEFEIGAPATFVGLDNYTEFLTRDPVTYPAFYHMVVLTLFAVGARLTMPLLVAKLIYSLPGERMRFIYRMIFVIPMVVPGVAIQLIWGGMVYAEAGLINEVLRTFGLHQWTAGWLSQPQTALLACAMVGFPFVGGFEVLVYYAGLTAIPASVNEAALLEGCTGVRKFILIDIPMVMSQVKLLLILTVIGAIQGFENLLVLTGGGPGFKTTVPGLWMYLNAFSFQRFGYACAIGVVLFVLVLVITVINMKFFKSTEALTGAS